MTSLDDLLNQQIDYYDARAPEYDQWFLRQGRYDRGEEHRARWQAEIAHVARALETACPGGDVLELASGTGLWTRRLAPSCDRLTAVDASANAIELCRRRVDAPHVEYITDDIFRWRPDRRFDFIFFGFWLSHVPEQRFGAFWSLVRDALKPGGQAYFVDSLFTSASSAMDHGPVDRSGISARKLNDGRAFRIVKVFYEPDRLTNDLSALGWTARIRTSGAFFMFGSAWREADD
ncbi:MAG: SAM-dependent methyltransferase [Phycisphaeraceae bacterium]|nr:SAM-dependent methyltransferase [Phycisphaeraceae bacterium]